MQVIEQLKTLRETVTSWHRAAEKVVLVPTMGNLHAGHLRLVKAAAELGEHIVVTIFVNPAQFVAGEDYETYPRTLDADLAQLADTAAELVFIPDVSEVYPAGLEGLTQVSVPALDNIFCGRSRPGHFTGVATVVTKLFNLVQADIAVFGEKDFQQLKVIKKLVEDLNLRIEVIGIPTVREADGLAMSSRNSYLSKEQRRLAPLLYQSLTEMQEKIFQGYENYRELEEKYRFQLESAGFMVDYLTICDADDLSIADNAHTGNMVILVAASLGRARLIDNLSFRR